MTYGLWSNPRYLEAAALILGGLILLAGLVFILKRKGPPYTTAWVSLKSWLFVAPMLFAAFALPKPWPLVFITWMGVLSAKSFFQLVGMYHRSWFVWITYFFIFALGHMINEGWLEYYNVMPEAFLATILMIPLIRNSATHIIQYIALSLLAFLFWGWAYMHMGKLIMFEGGELMVLYLYLLTEASENSQWACSRLFGRLRPFNKISNRISVEGMIVALCVTMLLAWGMRHLLPDRSEKFWIASGLIAAIFGRMGDLIINVFRRDLGLKNTGVFIIGRDGILTRVEKLIFVGPMYYYIYIYMQQTETAMKDWDYENEQWTQLPPHLKHLPLFTRHFDLTSWIFRVLWAIWLKGWAFRFYIRLEVVGDFHKLHREHPRLLLISNHASHLDAVSIAAAVPFRYWVNLYITAAKDYWFRNPVFTYFSKHCLGAIPIDRKDKKGEAIKLCTTLLDNLPRIWLILFPEGTRSKDGYINVFKRGVSLFAIKTDTPVLFLYLDGNNALWPKGRPVPFPGSLKIHVGPVHPPAPIDELYEAYREWVIQINPNAYRPSDLPDSDEDYPENNGAEDLEDE